MQELEISNTWMVMVIGLLLVSGSLMGSWSIEGTVNAKADAASSSRGALMLDRNLDLGAQTVNIGGKEYEIIIRPKN